MEYSRLPASAVAHLALEPTRATVAPTSVVTILSFVVFWAPPASADALGYGITVIVVVILMQVVLIGLLPICGELLWVDLFIFLNTGFCMVSLLQSAVT